MPPPATIGIVRAFELCGPPPRKSARALDVAEIEVEDSEDFEHGDIEVLDEEFEFNAEEFEHGDFDVLEEKESE
jgi:hypothetical protein